VRCPLRHILCVTSPEGRGIGSPMGELSAMLTERVIKYKRKENNVTKK